MPLHRIPRTLHSEAIFQILGLQIMHDHRPDMAETEILRERNLGDGFRLAVLE